MTEIIPYIYTLAMLYSIFCNSPFLETLYLRPRVPETENFEGIVTARSSCFLLQLQNSQSQVCALHAAVGIRAGNRRLSV